MEEELDELFDRSGLGDTDFYEMLEGLINGEQVYSPQYQEGDFE